MKQKLKEISANVKKYIHYITHNPRPLIIYIITNIVLSSEVWVPYLLGLIIPSIRIQMWSIGSVCWAFWLGPFTPFIPLCILITLGIDSLILKLRRKTNDNN